MLTFFFAFLFGSWFYKTAEKRAGRNPHIWGPVGTLVFGATSTLFSWGVSSMYVIMLIRNYEFSQTLAYVTAGGTAVAAWLFASGVTLSVYKIFLQEGVPGYSWSFKQARQDTAARRSLAMPGPFPFSFFVFYLAAMLGSMALLMLSILLLREYPAGTMDQGKLLLDVGCAILKTFGYTLVLWKCRQWFTIAAGWAVVTLANGLCHALYLAITKIGFVPQMFYSFAPIIVTTFITMSITALVVRQWGASLPVLLAACLLPDMFIDLPLMLLTVPNHSAMPELYVTPVIWSVLSAMAFYMGLLSHKSRAEATDAPPGAAVAFSG